MKWLILIALAQGSPFAIKHNPFETEDSCVEYLNDYSNADTLAMEVIAIAGFNNPVTGVFCVTEQEAKTYETIQKL